MLPYLIGGQLAVLGVSLATAPEVPAPEGTFGPTFWATVGLILTTILGFVFQAYRESRDRRWKREDAETKVHIAEQAAQHDIEAKRGREMLADKIDANTEISVKAFNAANDLNLKMAKAQETVAKAAETVAAAVNPPPPQT